MSSEPIGSDAHAIIVCEGKFSGYAKVKSTVRPSEYRKDRLGMGRRVKSREFLKGYWNSDSLVKAAREYKRVSKLTRGEHCLADILR